jgi:hypothetical protein
MARGHVNIYCMGIPVCSVCVPAAWTREEVEQEVNRASPTGIDSPWKISPDALFRTGETNPCPCETDAERKHYLMNC